MSEREVTLTADGQSFVFRFAPLLHDAKPTAEMFALKNNKTVRQTLEHRRYQSLAATVLQRYPATLDMKLGDFLVGLKRSGDSFYLTFLNPHGDLAYSGFSLADLAAARLKGLYCFTSPASAGGRLLYVGQSRDSFAKRITQGYGRIHPKNCFRDGQSTNCHLNALITKEQGAVALYICPMVDDRVIDLAEAALIRRYNPPWNVQLRGYGAA